MPSVFGKEAKKKELIKNLDSLYSALQREHQISPGDFPDLKKLQVHIVGFCVCCDNIFCLNSINELLTHDLTFVFNLLL